MPIIPFDYELLATSPSDVQMIFDAYQYWPNSEQERIAYISRCLAEQMAVLDHNSTRYRLLHDRWLKIGGFKTLNLAKSKNEYAKALSNEDILGDLALVGGLLLTLVRLDVHHHELAPSLNKAKQVIHACTPNLVAGAKIKSNYTRIEHAWRKYKSVSHISAAGAMFHPFAQSEHAIHAFAYTSNILADFLSSFTAVG